MVARIGTLIVRPSDAPPVLARCLLVVSTIVGVPGPVSAVDGVIEINQARALAGAVTPGDAAGFPVVIDQPGSYRLTGNLDLPNAGTLGIFVTAPDVTIDLNGFAIRGVTTCTGAGPTLVCAPQGTGQGIFSSEPNVAVRGGTVQGAGSDGVVLTGQPARVEGVHAVENAGTGILLGGHASVEGCVARRNGARGIRVGVNGRVGASMAAENGTNGIAAEGSGSLVERSVSRGNGGHGIAMASKGLAIRNRVSLNTGVGLNLGSGAGYVHNVVDDNTAGVISGGVQLEKNVCDGDLTCP